MAEEDKGGGVGEAETTVKKKSKGIISRLWNGIFRQSRDDFEKRLQYLSKEEAAVHARLQRRSLSRRLMTRRLIFFSVFLEVIAVGYAIVTTRSLDLNWKMRAFRVLPMFLLPGLSALFYSAFVNFIGLCERKDQKTLERLQAERQAKIDELKERTNYYTTQQLIQRYDPDPAAKAAAATVLASKLGSDSGLKVYVGDESKLNAPTGKSNDVEFVQASGLRNRKQHTRSSSAGSSPMHVLEQEMPHSMQSDGPMISERGQLVEHENPQAYAANDGGWIARLAALLVGEDPMQSYALICGNCHMHNGLARKEDYSYVTYYCPHCHALNQPKQLQERVPGSNSNLSTVVTGSGVETSNKNANVSPIDSTQSSSSPVATGSEIGEPTEMAASGDLPS